MTDETARSLRRVENLEEFVQLAELSSVHFERLSGERVNREGKPDESFAPEITAFRRQSQSAIEVRLVVVASSSECRILADVAANFQYAEPLDVTEEVLNDFVPSIGVMVAFPYAREGIQSTAARLNIKSALTIGLLRQGEMQKTDASMSPDEIETSVDADRPDA